MSTSSACGSVLEEPIGAGAQFTPEDFWRDNSVRGVARAVVKQDGGNGILYHLMLHGWLLLAGTSDFAVRVPSAVAGVLTVFWTYALAARLTTPAVAWWAGLIAAIHPLLIQLSQEARPYACATALAVLSTLLFVHILEGSARTLKLAAYGLSATAIVLTHYLAAVVPLAHAGFVVLRPAAAGVRRRVFAALITGGLLAAAWIPLGGGRGLAVIEAHDRAYRGRADATDAFVQPASLRTIAAGTVQQASAVLGNTLQNWGIRLSRLSALLALPAVLIAAGWHRGGARARSRDAIWLVTTLAAASLMLAVVLALVSGHVISFQPRYGCFVVPFAATLAAMGIGVGGRAVRVATVGQLAIMVTSLIGVYADSPQYRPRNPYPALAAAVRAAPGGTLRHRSWPEARIMNLYLRPGPTPVQATVGAR